MKTVFTSTENAILFGTLLGDAHLNCRGENSYRLKVEHSTKQWDYCQWKRTKLMRLCQKNKDVHVVSSKGKADTCMFYTDSNVAYKPIHQLFYTQKPNSKGKQTYVKTISPELIAAMPKDPLVLACFFMDDGSVRNDAYSGKIATQSFSKVEHELLQTYVLDSFGVKLDIICHIRAKEQYYFSIPASQFPKFVDVISPILEEVPSMKYKVNKARKKKSMYT
jgi:hypothetical protein